MNDTKVTRPESLAARVRRGVALLDEKMPGWHERIDVEVLDLSNSSNCVLGQLYGTYWRGFETVRAGNSAGFGLFDHEPSRAYRTLTRLWRFVVRTRQAAAFFAHPDVQGDGFDLVYAIAANGDVWCWSEKYGWRKSVFGNLNADSDFDRAHFADHLVRVSPDELPAGAR